MDENTLPDNIYELKRPALVALCKQRGIKAVGKNADLIEKLQNNAQGDHEMRDDLEQETDGDDETIDVEVDPRQEMETTAGEVSAMQLATSRSNSQIPDYSMREASLAAVDSSAYSMEVEAEEQQPSTPASPSKIPSLSIPKRARSKTPDETDMDDNQQDDRLPPLQAANSTPRRVAPLPRKSLAACSPLRGVSTPSRQLYPAVPSSSPFRPSHNSAGTTADTEMPKFTFVCPSPLAKASSASATIEPSAEATSSVLDQLNARLNASGHNSAAITASQSSSTLPISASSTSLRQKLEASGEARGETRFKDVHEKQWKKEESIANHWSLKRRKVDGHLSSASEREDAEFGAIRKTSKPRASLSAMRAGRKSRSRSSVGAQSSRVGIMGVPRGKSALPGRSFPHQKLKKRTSGAHSRVMSGPNTKLPPVPALPAAHRPPQQSSRTFLSNPALATASKENTTAAATTTPARPGLSSSTPHKPVLQTLPNSASHHRLHSGHTNAAKESSAVPPRPRPASSTTSAVNPSVQRMIEVRKRAAEESRMRIIASRERAASAAGKPSSTTAFPRNTTSTTDVSRQTSIPEGSVSMEMADSSASIPTSEMSSSSALSSPSKQVLAT